MRILGVYVSYETVMLALIVVLILSLIAQGKVRRVFNRYNSIPAARGIPAYAAAQEMLLDNGSAVTVHPVQGTLTDHYDPRNDTVGLSTEVYNSTSVAALAIAAHDRQARRRPEIRHDDRRAEQRPRRNGVHDTIGPELGGVFVAHGDSALQPGAHGERTGAADRPEGVHPRPHAHRHDRAENRTIG